MYCKPLYGLTAGLGWDSLCKAPERFCPSYILKTNKQIEET